MFNGHSQKRKKMVSNTNYRLTCLMQVNIIAECSAILSTFNKQPFVIKISVLSILSGRFAQVLLYSVEALSDCLKLT